MNRLRNVLIAIGIAAIALAACGGGSTTPTTAPQAPAGTQLNQASPQPGVASRTSVGNVQLVLSLPGVLHGRNAQAIRAAHGLRTARVSPRFARRGPAFVDPGNGTNIIDIYVDGELIPSQDGCAGQSDSLCVNTTSDGTQTLQLPLFSTNTNGIVVEEFDSCGNSCGNLLAIGDTVVPSFKAGSAVSATVTMQMNAASIGILDVYNQADPELLQGQQYFGLVGTCGAPNQLAQFGLYAADNNGNFVPISGYGGTSVPTESAISDGGGSTLTPQSTISGLYSVAWDQRCDGVTVRASAINPAAAISFDVLGPYPQNIVPEVGPRYYWTNSHGSQASFEGPFITDQNNAVYGTFGYTNCASGVGPCPGGPHQAAWNQVWYYNYNYAGAFFVLYGDVNPPVASGSVDILSERPVPVATPSGSSGGVNSSPIPLPSTPDGSGGVSSSPIPI